MNYGITLWGNTYKYILHSLEIMQKKAVRIMAKKPYDFSASEIFNNYKIMSLKNLYLLNNAKVMFRRTKNELPLVLNNYFIINQNIHNYLTRRAREPHLYAFKTNMKKSSHLYQIPNFWLTIPEDIKNVTHIKLFTKRLKRYLLLIN